MRTTLNIDDDLWQEAWRVTDPPSKRALIEMGLRELVRRAARQRAIALAGSMPAAVAPPRRNPGETEP